MSSAVRGGPHDMPQADALTQQRFPKALLAVALGVVLGRAPLFGARSPEVVVGEATLANKDNWLTIVKSDDLDGVMDFDARSVAWTATSRTWWPSLPRTRAATGSTCSAAIAQTSAPPRPRAEPRMTSTATARRHRVGPPAFRPPRSSPAYGDCPSHPRSPRSRQAPGSAVEVVGST